MLIRKGQDIRSSEITPKRLYLNRREFLGGAAIAGVAAVTGVGLSKIISPSATVLAGNKIDGIKKSPFSTTETITPYVDVTNYNNYYEFSTDKDGPAKLAKNFRTRPWKVKIEGQVEKKQEFVQHPGSNVDCTFLAESNRPYYVQVLGQRNTSGPYTLTVTVRHP